MRACVHATNQRPCRRSRNNAREAAGIRESPARVADWQAHNKSGIWTGPLNAPVVITEFMDLQCPYCAQLVPRMDTIHAEFPEAAVVFQHFPLANHPAALPGAIAVECGERQGRFPDMVKLLYPKRDSLGRKPWRGYAIAAGVLDAAAFDRCVKLPVDSFPRIAAGMAIGRRTNVRGTPTVWVNREVVRPVQLVQLREAVSRALLASRKRRRG